jgi:hypothetical protein
MGWHPLTPGLSTDDEGIRVRCGRAQWRSPLAGGEGAGRGGESESGAARLAVGVGAGQAKLGFELLNRVADAAQVDFGVGI